MQMILFYARFLISTIECPTRETFKRVALHSLDLMK